MKKCQFLGQEKMIKRAKTAQDFTKSNELVDQNNDVFFVLWKLSWTQTPIFREMPVEHEGMNHFFVSVRKN